MSEFNETMYKRAWQKEHMKTISAKFKNEFVDEFKEACAKLGISQADVIREAMKQTIEKANSVEE